MSKKLLDLNETTDDQLVIIREFNAPRQIVFDALTKHEHIKRWACPKGMNITDIKVELEVGKSYEYAMKSPEGPEIILSGVYREINPPSKLVYTQFALMPDGSEYPETLITITLEEVGNQTQMIFHHTEFQTKQDRDNANMGWPSAFDNLKAVVEELKGKIVH